MSQPRPRVPALAGNVTGVIMRATVAGDRIRTPSSSPPLINMRTKRFRSCAVLNRPACPATPPMRRAVGSCTTPRNGAASGRLHGHASCSAHRSVGAIRGTIALAGRNPVSRMPSGPNTTRFRYTSSASPVTRATISPSRKKLMSL